MKRWRRHCNRPNGPGENSPGPSTFYCLPRLIDRPRKGWLQPALNAYTDNRQLLVDYITDHQREHYRLAFSYVKNRDAALDVVQESIVKSLTKIDSLREPAYLKTWFYRILLNESMNHFRKNKDLLPFDEVQWDRPAEARDPGDLLDLYAAIDRLTPQEQALVRLRFFEDMKLEEIANVTGTNLNTVKSRLYKTLKKLRDMTGEELHDEP